MFAEDDGDYSVSGGGFAEVQGAVAGWQAIPNTSLSLSYGGTMNYSLACTSGQDTPAYGVNVIIFNDPCLDIGGPCCNGVPSPTCIPPDSAGLCPGNCSGTLAFDEDRRGEAGRAGPAGPRRGRARRVSRARAPARVPAALGFPLSLRRWPLWGSSTVG